MVGVVVKVWTDIEIKADTLEEAIAEGRKLKVQDVVSFDTSYNDGSIEVVGAFGEINVSREDG